MSFWSTPANPTIADPKRKFRFYVEFQGLAETPNPGALLWWAKQVNKPSFSTETATHEYLNYTFKYPGKVTWDDISLTLVDPVNPDMAATLSDILVQSGYSIPTNAETLQMSTLSKGKSAGALGMVTITQIDASGNDLEKWTLNNAFITKVAYGDLAYGDDGLTEMTVTLAYDWASLLVTTDGSKLKIPSQPATTFFEV